MCIICNNESYKNPIPVVVGLIRVFQKITGAPCGWLVEQRGIEPKKGEWALPGGYINFGEDWKEGLCRELIEEVGLVTKPEDFELFEIVNVPATGNMLIFGYHKRGVYIDEVKFEINHEVLAIKFPILPSHQELCFPSHNEMWGKCYYSID
jgi:ADP-ribose pyrophosphatase YjhB (NUDIX family)